MAIKKEILDELLGRCAPSPGIQRLPESVDTGDIGAATAAASGSASTLLLVSGSGSSSAAMVLL